MILYGLISERAESTAATLESSDAAPGYTCFGGSGIFNDGPADITFLAGWAPGTGVTRFPADTGIPVATGRKMIMQVHYNMAGGRSGTDKTGIDLALASSVTKPAVVFPLADLDMSLPAGLAEVSTSVRSFPLPVAQIYGVFPHMHTLGRKIRVDHIKAAGGKGCVVDVPRWDFEWQQFFFFSSENGPISVSAGDRFELTCTYDTSSRSGPDPISWGDGTQDEMCINFFYATF